MTVLFLVGAGACLGLLVLLIAAASHQPNGPMGMAGPFILLLGGIPVFLALALISWIIGG